MALKTDVDVSLIASVVKEVLQQMGQQGTQQSSQQIAEAVQQTIQKMQGSQQERSMFSENKAEEINTGEAHRAAIFSDKEMWSFNKKALIEKSQDFDRSLKGLELAEKQLELQMKQHDFSQKQKLDNLHLRGAEQAELVKHMLNVEYAKFNGAISEPIAPNTQDSGAKK